jgi:hypothetical protein
VKKLSALVGAVAVLALAGCSTSKAPTSDMTTYPPTVWTLQVVAQHARCVTMTPTTEIGTKDAATCTVNGHDLYLYTFADDAARDNWLKVGKAAGALGSFQEGTSWVIQTL